MDYPVMLYLGGLNSHAIAHDDDEYDKLTERGYITHAEAVKIEPKADEQETNDEQDQLAEAYEHIELLENAIDVKDGEILDLKGQVDAANKRCAEKEQELVDFKNSTDDTQEVADLKAKLAIYEESKDVNGVGVTSYDDMEKDELKALLDERGVKYVSRDNLDDLIQKAKDSE